MHAIKALTIIEEMQLLVLFCITLTCALCRGAVEINPKTRELKTFNKNGDIALEGFLGRLIPVDSIPTLCSNEGGTKSGEGECFQWPDGTTLTISPPAEMGNAVCQEILWNATSCVTEAFEDCFSLETAHWYGGAQIKRQLWPIEKWNQEMAPYIPNDSYQGQYGGIQERYFFNSNGTSIFAEYNSPLWVSINASNDKLLCLRGTYKDSPYFNIDNKNAFLKYNVCQAASAFEIHQYHLTAGNIGKPAGIPDEKLFRYPIWSTWVRYGRNINQQDVLAFADEILANGFPHAQIEVDDNWETYYGSLEFNSLKFPDPAAMVNTLTSKGFRTTVWVHPFTDMYSEGLRLGTTARALVTDPGRNLPALTSWWNGNAAILDATGTSARAWYSQKLAKLKTDYNISSFKFDAGEANWLPAAYSLQTVTENPGDYSTAYANMAYAADSDLRILEVRVGIRAQHLPVFVRMMDKDSRWDEDNGLRTLIPHVLLFGVLGYPFALPDMIGGNAYGIRPTKELFIRWLEVNVFLPSIQFSIAPWDFDNETVAISRDLLALRARYADQLITLANEAAATGHPIIRPLWWIARDDPVALSIDSEFLVGNNLLVAPVLYENATSRDIYLPVNMLWRDELRGDNKVGGWYNNYEVALHELPHFTLVA